MCQRHFRLQILFVQPPTSCTPLPSLLCAAPSRSKLDVGARWCPAPYKHWGQEFNINLQTKAEKCSCWCSHNFETNTRRKKMTVFYYISRFYQHFRVGMRTFSCYMSQLHVFFLVYVSIYLTIYVFVVERQPRIIGRFLWKRFSAY